MIHAPRHRTVPGPMNKAALVPMPCWAHLCSALAICKGLLPSSPVATVVTPCIRYASLRLVAGLKGSSKVLYADQ
jgi:hypothetical protein